METERVESAAVEALVQYIWNVESHHWTCDTCHPLSEIENGVVVPAHPHLKALRRRRKEMLRVQLMKEGNKVGGMRAENEVLVRILQDDTDNQRQDSAVRM